MLTPFVAFLLVFGGSLASEDCDFMYCNTPEMPSAFPITAEELQNICKPGIETLECELDYTKRCQGVDSDEAQYVNKILAFVKQVCSEDTLLHAAVVDNLKCVSELLTDQSKFCTVPKDESPKLIMRLVEALKEEGIVSLTHSDNNTYNIHECIGMLNYFACHAIHIENNCGNIAKAAFVEILQVAGPVTVASCENAYDILPTVIRLRRIEEEQLSDVFRRKK